MVDPIKVSLVVLVKHKGKEHKFGLSLADEPCVECDPERLLNMLFDAGMQTAIVEVNKLIKKEVAGVKGIGSGQG